MTKACFWSDEVYPIYFLQKDDGCHEFELDLTDDELAWFKRVMADFWDVQNLIHRKKRNDTTH